MVFIAFRRATLLALLLTPFINGFMPQDWREEAFGAGGISHESQTRNAFDALAKEWWKLSSIPNTMVKARSTIMKANADVDDDQIHSARHFDGENFVGGQYVLTGTPLEGQASTADMDKQETDLFNLIQFHLDNGFIVDARKALGVSLKVSPAR